MGVLFALVMLYVTFLHQKRKEFSTSELSFWVLLWVLFIYVTVLPRSLNFLIETLNFTRVFDFLVVVGFIFVTSLGIFNYFNSKSNKKDIEDIVRKIALKKRK